MGTACLQGKYCAAINSTHKKSEFIAPLRQYKLREEEAFVVRHYAGDVVYHTSAIVAKASKQREVPLCTLCSMHARKHTVMRRLYSSTRFALQVMPDTARSPISRQQRGTPRTQLSVTAPGELARQE